MAHRGGSPTRISLRRVPPQTVYRRSADRSDTVPIGQGDVVITAPGLTCCGAAAPGRICGDAAGTLSPRNRWSQAGGREGGTAALLAVRAGGAGDLMIGHFADADAEARFRAAYAEGMARMSPPSGTAVIPTEFGQVHVHRFGSAPGTPLVLLPA
jgi:hypothetical protein